MTGFFLGIKNIFTWFKIIWNDRQWDSYFLLVLMQYKLTLMQKYFETNAHHLEADKNIIDIKICKNLLKRLAEDDYYKNVFLFHDEKWGKLNITFEDDNRISITRKNCVTEQEKKEEKKEAINLRDKEALLIDQDLNLLFKIMRKQIKHWWD